MIAIKTADLTQDFKRVADRIIQGETVLISRPRNENIVMITEKEYNVLIKNLVDERMKDFTGYEGFWEPEEKEKMFSMDYEVEYAIQSVRAEKQVKKLAKSSERH